jgi:hypothetical protein
MADINSIIERMAAGQKEIVGQSVREPEVAEPDPMGDTDQFDPIPASPSAPIAARDPSDEPVQTLEATTDDLTPARGVSGGRSKTEPIVQVHGAWERTPEVATAIGTADAEDKLPDAAPADNEVTGEISMDQIRRDLERRIREEKGGK